MLCLHLVHFLMKIIQIPLIFRSFCLAVCDFFIQITDNILVFCTLILQVADLLFHFIDIIAELLLFLRKEVFEIFVQFLVLRIRFLQLLNR